MADDLQTQRDIRERRYPARTSAPNCSFHIGRPGYPCKRCSDLHGFDREDGTEPRRRAATRKR